MKVRDLQCELAHVFEGWFASEEDFRAQQVGGQIHCPMCGSDAVSKRLSAPRLNFGVGSSVTDTERTDPAKALQQQWLTACRHIIENTVDVGTEFAAQARKIHHGVATERSIRGQATVQETRALLDEGITVVPLFLPEGLTGPVQ